MKHVSDLSIRISNGTFQLPAHCALLSLNTLKLQTLSHNASRSPSHLASSRRDHLVQGKLYSAHILLNIPALSHDRPETASLTLYSSPLTARQTHFLHRPAPNTPRRLPRHTHSQDAPRPQSPGRPLPHQENLRLSTVARSANT